MKSIKFKQETAQQGNSWTDWLRPRMKGYHLSCCDCGLVHTFNFRVFKVDKRYKDGGTSGIVLPTKDYEIEFKVKRNNTLTKQQRN